MKSGDSCNLIFLSGAKVPLSCFCKVYIVTLKGRQVSVLIFFQLCFPGIFLKTVDAYRYVVMARHVKKVSVSQKTSMNDRISIGISSVVCKLLWNFIVWQVIVISFLHLDSFTHGNQVVVPTYNLSAKKNLNSGLFWQLVR